jgi:hypothetical protein
MAIIALRMKTISVSKYLLSTKTVEALSF